MPVVPMERPGKCNMQTVLELTLGYNALNPTLRYEYV